MLKTLRHLRRVKILDARDTDGIVFVRPALLARIPIMKLPHTFGNTITARILVNNLALLTLRQPAVFDVLIVGQSHKVVHSLVDFTTCMTT